MGAPGCLGDCGFTLDLDDLPLLSRVLLSAVRFLPYHMLLGSRTAEKRVQPLFSSSLWQPRGRSDARPDHEEWVGLAAGRRAQKREKRVSLTATLRRLQRKGQLKPMCALLCASASVDLFESG